VTGPPDAQRGSGPRAGHGAGWAASAPGAAAARQVCASCQGRARERRRLGARARANAGELGLGMGRGGALHGLWLGALERGGPGEARRAGPPRDGESQVGHPGRGNKGWAFSFSLLFSLSPLLLYSLYQFKSNSLINACSTGSFIKQKMQYASA
jgi:hypothetical protein